MLVTGGPDCTVRVWNPFVPSRPSVTLLGHHAGITSIVLQNGGQTVYSLSRDRVIKVWDVQGQQCVQVRRCPICFTPIGVVVVPLIPRWSGMRWQIYQSTRDRFFFLDRDTGTKSSRV